MRSKGIPRLVTFEVLGLEGGRRREELLIVRAVVVVRVRVRRVERIGMNMVMGDGSCTVGNVRVEGRATDTYGRSWAW